jgi:protein-L-isoaspartate(D-aspartate) O-methyltransferase
VEFQLSASPAAEKSALTEAFTAQLHLIYNRDMRNTEFHLDAYASARRAMVETQIRKRGVSSARVLEAMATVPRHEFISAELRNDAYADKPLPIGEGQTISQPYMVAAMTEALELRGAERVLEIGTGSGYQAAVLSSLVSQVITVENHTSLALAAQERLAKLGYTNVHVHNGDGSAGLPDAAPFDAILVTAGAPQIPQVFANQLREGGRIVIPVGDRENQDLVCAEKKNGELKSRVLFGCKFVLLLGRYGWNRDERKFQ